VTPPSVHQMLLTLERGGLISRRPGAPRSIAVLVDRSGLPASEPGYGQPVKIGCYSPRAPGIAAYSESGIALENAQTMVMQECQRIAGLHYHMIVRPGPIGLNERLLYVSSRPRH